MLADLPAELLNQIVTHCPTRSVGRLSQTSRALHGFVEKEGWRTFTQSHFASLDPPSNRRDAARSLTTLSRNWDRRAFLATYMEPVGDATALPDGQPIKKWKRPGGQTMGFQPAIDSYEHFFGSRWTDRRQVVAWSAGAELVVRVKVRDEASEDAFRNASPQDKKDKFQSDGTRVSWWTYKPLSSVQGRDDITSVKIIRSDRSENQSSIDHSEHIVVGTANGDLQLIEIPPINEGCIKTYFVTNGVPVRSTSLSPTNEGTRDQPQQIAVNLSDSRIALYPIDSAQSKIAPISEINATPQGRKGCRIWSTNFLDSKRLAIGLGPSVEPINIFEIRPEGIVEEPIRRIGLSGSVHALEPGKASSIYPIETILDGNGGRDSNHFLSGGYDGIVRLHDLRSPASIVATYRDPTDDAAVYSLLSRGRDRVIAGTSRHGLLKIFDLRMAGGNMYDYAGPNGSTDDSTTGDWNIFINPRDRYANSSWRGPNSWMRRSAEGSVYSLSSPSPSSSCIFAGVENAVVEFNFSSVLDKHPDPIFVGETDTRKDSRYTASPSYLEHKRDVLNLAMYSQGTDGSREGMKLRLQRSVEETLGQERNLVGLDERWKDSQ